MSTDERSRTPRLAPLTSMEELAASIAHEVSQPLSAIVVNAKCCLLWLGKEQPDLDMARKAAERIIRNGQHASAVIRSVRALHGSAKSEMSRVNVNAVISDTVELLGPEIGAQCITLETQLGHTGNVDGDRTQIQQVLINLLRNGIEAMRETDWFPRTLQVRSSMDAAGDVSIAVADTGPGLDSATAERMFEPFFTTKSGGMGLGLAICRSIVLAHGGHLWARPRAPHGCTFEFTLPAHGQC